MTGVIVSTAIFLVSLGGNTIIVGSTANLVIVELSDRTSTPITAALWSRRGLPVALVSIIVVSVLFALGFNLLVR